LILAKRIVKILFLAGSLEPGKDGVGDYTRVLANECARLGHETFLVSINDPWVATSVKEDAFLRLGTGLPWSERAIMLRTIFEDSRPDIVSLQFVPYAFQPRGLPLALLRILRIVIGRIPVQIMFHEIWIGAQIRAPLKCRVTGFCQRKIIENLVKSLNCRVIHTSATAYTQLLWAHGIQAKRLPLFGNIPIAPWAQSIEADRDGLILGMFGAIHPEWSADNLLPMLTELHRPIQLFHVGRIGPGEPIWRDISERYGSRIQLLRFGEQALERISELLLSADFGIATTPLALIEKSGSVAAMLDHGLPVVVSRNDIQFPAIPEVKLSSQLLIPVDQDFQKRLSSVKRQPAKARLPEVAEQFLKDISV
jgi:glycosyltransferase involved in cell wall biosynthesis